MTLARFADEKKVMSHGGERWCCYLHKRSTSLAGLTALATAVVLKPTKVRRLPSVENKRNARIISFGKPLLQQRVSLAALREACGRPHWRARWAPRLRMVFDTAVFDMMLVARALDGIRATSGKVTIEIGEIDRGHLLRVVGKRWRVVVAGRLEVTARPMILAAHTKSADRAPK